MTDFIETRLVRHVHALIVVLLYFNFFENKYGKRIIEKSVSIKYWIMDYLRHLYPQRMGVVFSGNILSIQQDSVFLFKPFA